VLLKQKKRPVLNITGFFFQDEYSGEGRGAYITGFFFRMTTQVVVLFLLIVVLFGFLNIKSVKIYAIPFIFSTTLLLYKLDTLLLKQNSSEKNRLYLDIYWSKGNNSRYTI
jgi:hypothetical protein